VKFIDLFAGIGGFRLGMEMAGHECVGHCEIDKFAQKSYKAMHEPKEGEWFADDITRVTPEELPEADCYCGGFPCQSFSIAGKRGGFEDTRGTLFFEIMRLARIRKPKYLFLENVKGLLSHDGGKTFGTILSVMGECGYDAQWQVLNSAYYTGQDRERVFVVANIREEPMPKVFPIIKKEKFYPTSPTITTRYPFSWREGLYIVEARKQEGETWRDLTPRECFRLQGFPDEYFERAMRINSDTQLYKQVGNSVTVNVVYQIAKKLD
jgi:DNA (cytosine-5)-methyltransferase 1